MSSESRYLDAHGVAVIANCSVAHAYTLIRRLNLELKSQNFITISGKIPKAYFEERLRLCSTETEKKGI